jgi:acyl carrier protein
VSVPHDVVLARVIELAASFAAHPGPVTPGPDTTLAGGGFWLDSLALLELLVACEETFGVCLDHTELLPHRLKTTGTLAALIESRLAATDGPHRT